MWVYVSMCIKGKKVGQCVCMYVCGFMYVRMYVRMYVCMYSKVNQMADVLVKVCVCMYDTYVCMNVCQK